MNNEDLIQSYIMRDMSEGVMTIGFSGKITYVNPAAEIILEKNAEELVGRSFAISFFGYELNDGFNQLVLDAIYDRNNTHEGVVDYYSEQKVKQLHIRTSFLTNGEEPIGIICVLSDVTELSELRDAMKAMELIKAANDKLELRNRLLSETFGRFLSDDIVRQLLDTPDGLALGGKKEYLTVLMSDLRGFTALAEKMDPHELLNMLNHYLGVMTEIIQKYGGTILEFIGDGIMVVFGAPAYFPDHAVKAVAASLEMQKAMEQVNQWNLKKGYPRLGMGIGINTGSIIIGNIGSEKRTKYGATGSSVNLAGRIESYTVGGQILLSDSVLAEISEKVEIGKTMEVIPKGVKEPMTLYQAVGLGDPYNIYVSPKEEKQEMLTVPLGMKFRTIDGKHVSAFMSEGELISLKGAEGTFRTEKVLSLYDNLEMVKAEAEQEEKGNGSKIYAKVTEILEEGYLLEITSGLEYFL